MALIPNACRLPIRAQPGFAVPFLHSAPGTNTTYGSLTLGVTWKPELPALVSGLLIRPEVRWDHAFTNNRPFNAQRDNNGFTIGADFVLTFRNRPMRLYEIYMSMRPSYHRIYMVRGASLSTTHYACRMRQA